MALLKDTTIAGGFAQFGFARFGPADDSSAFQGVTLVHGKDSSATNSTSFLDTRNNLDVADAHIFMEHQNNGGSNIQFGTTPDGSRSSDRRQERMRIAANGNVGIGTTDASNKLTVQGRGSFRGDLTGNFSTAALEVLSTTGNVGITLHCGGASAPMLRNERGVGEVIDIVNNPQTAFAPIRASAFNVTSDYRIKENVQPLGAAAERVALLKPCRFNFIEGSMMYQDGAAVDGFIAHEVQEVVPEAVSGVKDDLMDTGAPKHQSLDQSKLVPLLTAALQEALADIATLKAEVNALKGASA